MGICRSELIRDMIFVLMPIGIGIFANAMKGMIMGKKGIYDVLIVGAGPAGTSATVDLCRQGKTVLLLDRHSTPGHKACAGGLTIKTSTTLGYPVDPIIETRCRTLVIGNGFHRKTRFSGRNAVCAMAVRSRLDAFNREKAMASGAIFQKIQRIDSVEERESFVEVATSNSSIRAGFVIGADGAVSRIRKLTNGFEGIRYGFALEGIIPWKKSKMPEMAFDFHATASGYGWIFPKKDHLNIGLYTRDHTTPLTKDALVRYALKRLGTEDVRKISGNRMGMGGWRYHPKSPRVLLTGDAAGLVDPLLGEGLYNAVKSGRLAARAILTAMATDRSAASLYDRLLTPIRRDLLCGHLCALWFYKFPNLGYFVLTSPPVKYALMKGFALGMPLSRIMTHFFFLPFIKGRQ